MKLLHPLLDAILNGLCPPNRPTHPEEPVMNETTTAVPESTSPIIVPAESSTAGLSAVSREPGNVQTDITKPALPPAPAPAGPAKWVGNPTTATAPRPAPAPAPFPQQKWSPPPVAPAKPMLMPAEQPPCPEEVDQLLADILTWPRTHLSMAEERFCMWLASKITEFAGVKPTMRALGCLSVRVPAADGRVPPVLFVSHVDTVDGHDKGGFVGPDGLVMRKNVVYDANFGSIMVAKDNAVGNCLGADDGVGVWIMLRMLKAKVPGNYLFTRGEEMGRLGAGAMIRTPADTAWLETMQMSIEFDRPRNNEVITHQSGRTRCASDEFGKALAELFNRSPHLAYEISDKGVYTDNFDFRGVIPENVNIGVGYTSQHGRSEELDYAHAHALMLRCIEIDWDSLPVMRKAEIEAYTYSRGYNSGYSHGFQGHLGMVDDYDEPFAWQVGRGQVPMGRGYTPPPAPDVRDFPRRQKFKPQGRNLQRRVETPELPFLDELREIADFDDWVMICQNPREGAAIITMLLAEVDSLTTRNQTLMRNLKKRRDAKK